jgi:branched-chain amino acid aminotransferase
MPTRSNERVAGSTASSCRSEVRHHFATRLGGGDGGFDMTHGFGHRLFKVKEHVVRLYQSLKYLRIDPGFGP